MSTPHGHRFTSTVKDLLRPGYRALRASYRKVSGLEASLPLSPHGFELIRLGSDYGGWSFVDTDALRNATVVSCGLGEDASFDVEIAARYHAKVICVDPTPRAIRHHEAIAAAFGAPRSASYTKDGRQPVAAYDLSRLRAENLALCPKAVWTEATTLRFFAPKNETDVSHSIVNFQNGYSDESPHIHVQAVAIDELLAMYGVGTPALLKLDVEGAEIEVLTDMLDKCIFPPQVLVEYDELSVPSKRSKARVEGVHQQMLASGYSLIHREQINFLYVHESLA